jgi:membrane-bound metal-dependent hydrolase YbcI (DUF457 family)
MANFQTHLATSTVLGVGYGAAAYYGWHLPGSTCVLAAGFCSVSGMLPDIDSGPGRPLHEITSCLAAMVPALLYARFHRLGISIEHMILAAAAIYIAIRFGLTELMKLFTAHRGMFHSLPAAAIWGELCFLLFFADEYRLRCLIAGGAVLGYLSHLLLDEIYSVQLDGGARVKKSFGTALKLFGNGFGATALTYVCLFALSFLIIRDPALAAQTPTEKPQRVAQEQSRDLPVAAIRTDQANRNGKTE